MLDAFRGISLVAATITMGLITGAFALYAHTIMPGLKATDDRTFVTAFQSMDRAIINPWFMVGGFVGALVFTGVAAALHLGSARFINGLPKQVLAIEDWKSFFIFVCRFVLTRHESGERAMTPALPLFQSFRNSLHSATP